MSSFNGSENDYMTSAEEQQFLKDLRLHTVVCKDNAASTKYALRFLEKKEDPIATCIRLYAAMTSGDCLIETLFMALKEVNRKPSPQEAIVMFDLLSSKKWMALDTIMEVFDFKQHKESLKTKILQESSLIDPQIMVKLAVDLEMVEVIQVNQAN